MQNMISMSAFSGVLYSLLLKLFLGAGPKPQFLSLGLLIHQITFFYLARAEDYGSF